MQNQHIPPRAKETRALARETLKGQWPIAILTTFIAGLLGGLSSSSPTFNFDFSGLDLSDFNLQLPEEGIGIIGGPDFDLSSQFTIFWHTLWPIIVPILLGTLAISLIYLVIGPCIRYGLCRFQLDLIDSAKPDVATLFCGFKNMFLKALALSLVQFVIVFAVWVVVAIVAIVLCIVTAAVGYHTLLAFLVVAVVALGVAAVIVITYRFRMTFYILADNPDIDLMDTLRESTRMMAGNKWRLFCLQMSFIGWSMLCALTGGLGLIVLNPYQGQAEAIFYHHVSGRAAIRQAVEELAEFSEGL